MRPTRPFRASYGPLVVYDEWHGSLLSSRTRAARASGSFVPSRARAAHVYAGMRTTSLSKHVLLIRMTRPLPLARTPSSRTLALQIVLRWGVQRGTSVIPKTTQASRMRENFAIFDFELSEVRGQCGAVCARVWCERGSA